MLYFVLSVIFLIGWFYRTIYLNTYSPEFLIFAGLLIIAGEIYNLNK